MPRNDITFVLLPLLSRLGRVSPTERSRRAVVVLRAHVRPLQRPKSLRAPFRAPSVSACGVRVFLRHYQLGRRMGLAVRVAR